MELKFQNENKQWLCFKHATSRAFSGEVVNPVLDEDDFASEYDMRDTGCVDCREIALAKIDLDADAEGSSGLRAALDSVIAERARQDAKWGQQNHDPTVWMGILMEEVGEMAQAVNETWFDNGEVERAKGGYANMRKEAVEVAAVAVAFVEMLDRWCGSQ